MTVEKIREIAARFDVIVQEPGSLTELREGQLYLSRKGETVEGCYFSTDTQTYRLRKPDWPWDNGDFTVAIATALTRADGKQYPALLATIRSFA